MKSYTSVSRRLVLLLYGIVSSATVSNAQCPAVVFSTSIDDAPAPLSVNYVIAGDSLQGEVVYEGQAWLGFAISPEGGMDGSLGIIGTSEFPVGNANPGKWTLLKSGNVQLPMESQTITNGNIAQNATHTVLTFSKLLEEPGEPTIDPLGTTIFLVAVGSSNTPGYHAFRTGFPVTTDTETCVAAIGSSSGQAAETEPCSEVQFSHSIDGAPGPLTVQSVISGDRMEVEVVYEGLGWVGFAISPAGGMDGSLGIIGSSDFPVSASNPGKFLLNKGGNTLLQPQNQTLIDASITQTSTHTTLKFTKLLEEPGEPTIDPMGQNIFLTAVGSSNTPGYHAFRTGYPVTTDPTTCVAQVPTAQPEEPASCDQIRFSTAIDDAPAPLTVDYVISGDSMQVQVAYGGQGWLGFAISPEGGMDGSLGIIGTTEFPVGPGNPSKWQLQKAGNVQLPEAQQTLTNANIVQNDTHTVLSFTKLLQEPNEPSIDPMGQNIFLTAVGSSNTPGYHAFRTGYPVTTDPTTCLAQIATAPASCSQVQFSHTYQDIPMMMSYVISDDTLQGTVVLEGQGWIGFGISENGGMDGSLGIIGTVDMDVGDSNPGKYELHKGGNILLPQDQQTLTDANIVQNDTHTVLTFTKLLEEPGEIAILSAGVNHFLVAAGSSNAPGYHAYRQPISVEVNPETCVAGIAGAKKAREEFQVAHAFEGVPITLNYMMEFDTTTGDGTLQGEVIYEGQGWVGFGISESGGMEGALGIVGLPDEPLSESNPAKFHLSKGGPTVLDSAQQTLSDASITQNDTHTVLTFTKSLKEEGEVSIDPMGTNNFLVAGGSGNDFGYHAVRSGFAFASPFADADVDVTDDGEDAGPSASSSVSDGPVDCSEYQSSYDYPGIPITIHYVVNLDEETGNGNFSAQVVFDGLGWVGMGFSENGGMVGSLAVIGLPDEPNSATNPGKYNLGAQSPSGVTLTDQQTLMDATIEQTDSQTILTFTKLLQEPGEIAIDPEGSNFFLAAGGSANSLSFHSARGSVGLGLAPCTAEGVAEVGGPIEIAVADTEAYFIAHGLFLAISWGILAPIAIGNSLCRNFIPGAGLWFKIHQAFNLTVTILTFVAFFLAVSAIQKGNPDKPQHFKAFPEHAHRAVGLVVFIFVLIQAVGGLMRPHLPPKPEEGQEPEKKTSIRVAWEFIHKGTGFSLLAMSWYQVHTGLGLYADRFQANDLTVVFWVIAGILGGISLLGFLARVGMGEL